MAGDLAYDSAQKNFTWKICGSVTCGKKRRRGSTLSFIVQIKSSLLERFLTAPQLSRAPKEGV